MHKKTAISAILPRNGGIAVTQLGALSSRGVSANLYSLFEFHVTV
jgi:hypothetical protein